MDYKTIFYYRGIITYETIGELIHNFKLLVPKAGLPIGIYKRILVILIESLENMMKHSSKQILNEVSGDLQPFISIDRAENNFRVVSSNLINIKNIARLKACIDKLNKLDQKELKKIYKETITNGLFTEVGGAGLGLIEILKVSGNPIDYEFRTVNDEVALYFQTSTITPEKVST